MKVSLPLKAKSTSNLREHWRTKHKRTRAQRTVAMLRVRPLVANVAPALVVKLTRVSPRELDDDNLRGALKAVRDGVASALRVDDRTPFVRWDYAQRRGAPREQAVEVEFLALGHVAHSQRRRRRDVDVIAGGAGVTTTPPRSVP